MTVAETHVHASKRLDRRVNNRLAVLNRIVVGYCAPSQRLDLVDNDIGHTKGAFLWA
jgi:hypothetical protein